MTDVNELLADTDHARKAIERLAGMKLYEISEEQAGNLYNPANPIVVASIKEYALDRENNKPRAVATKDADNPAYWLYTDHVGMCQDFTNALVIMCKHHNIPCTSLADRKHVVPVVYINNEWVAIDVNPLLPECIEQDMGSSKWVHGEQYRWDREYGFAAYGMDQIEMCIDYLP